MCLLTTWKKPKTAIEDIVVYKVLEIKKLETSEIVLVSPYMFFTYNFNTLYTTEFEAEASDDPCPFDEEAQENRDNMINNGISYWAIGSGFHSALSEKRLQFNTSYYKKPFQGIIPAGSLYYEDSTGLIVSNQIIIRKEDNKKIIDIFNEEE